MAHHCPWIRSHGYQPTDTASLHQYTDATKTAAHQPLPISLDRRQRSWGAGSAQQKPSNSIQHRVEGGRECLTPTSSTSKASTSTAHKHHLGRHLEGPKQSKLKQPMCASPLMMHARPKVCMPPERAAALLRGLSGAPGNLAMRQVTDKAAMLESYLQDAHELSRETSSSDAVGVSQRISQDTPAASTSDSVHHPPALHYTAAFPLQRYPARQGSNSPSRSVRAGLSGSRWASGRAVLHDCDAAGSEWGGAQSIASTMKSGATAMYTRKIGYAEMHLERIAERWVLLSTQVHSFSCGGAVSLQCTKNASVKPRCMLLQAEERQTCSPLCLSSEAISAPVPGRSYR